MQPPQHEVFDASQPLTLRSRVSGVSKGEGVLRHSSLLAIRQVLILDRKHFTHFDGGAFRVMRPFI
jgi:hypothetical protein